MRNENRKSAIRLSNLTGLLLIAWSMVLHITFLISVPDPVFQPDSGRYVALAIDNHYGLDAHGPLLRGPGYPSFLWIMLHLTHSFLGVLVAQHVLVLIMAAVMAYLYRRLIRRSFVESSLVFFACSAMPLPAIYAHMILSETLYTLLFTAAIMLLSYNGERGKNAIGIAASFLAVLAVLTRPTGIALIGAMGVMAAASFWKTRTLSRWAYNTFTAGMLLLSICLYNRLARGFFGVDNSPGSALFCASAPYLDAGSIEDPALRALLEPIFTRNAARLTDGAWVYAAPDGPVEKLRVAYPPVEVDQIMRRLGLKAIKTHPFRYAGDRLGMFFEFFRSYTGIPGFTWTGSTVFSFIAA